MKKIKKLFTALVNLALLWPALLFAQAPGGGNPGAVIPTKPGNLPGSSGDTFNSVVRGYINIFLTVVGIIAVAFLIYGGFRYMTAGGNEEASEAAKKIIGNSLIGLIVIILSYVIIVVVSRALFGVT